MLTWTLLMLACGGSPPVAGQGSAQQPRVTLEAPPAGSPLRLSDRLGEARLELPLSNLPADAQVAGELVLGRGWKLDKAGEPRSTWTHALPFRATKKRHEVAPAGVGLSRGGTPLPFAKLPGPAPEGAWDIAKDRILVSSDRSPGEWPEPPVLASSAEQRLQGRLNLASSGLEPAEHARYELSIGGETRPGILLPAPARAAWTLRLPEGRATLEFTGTVVPRQLTQAAESDGATIRVEIDGQAKGSLSVSADGRFRSAEIDLSSHVGQEVELALVTDPDGDPAWDHVFLGEPMIWGPDAPSPKRVVFIGLDTTRFDVFDQHGAGRGLTDALEPLASTSVVFEQAFTPAPRTRPSFRTATSGRRPLAAMDAPTVGQLFRGRGYATAGVTANVHLVPRFGFNRGFDHWDFANARDADVELGLGLDWLRDNAGRNSFLFLHLMDPHNFYKAPGLYRDRYVTTNPGDMKAEHNRWKILAADRRGAYTDENRLWLEQRYWGEVAYMADQLAGFFDEVLALPGDTLIVMHSDHGEEFWEHGSYEHNHTLYQELVHAVLWIRPPGGWSGGPHRVSEPVALMDIVPTLVDLLEVPEENRPPFDGTSLRPYLDSGQAAELPALKETLAKRDLPIGHLMYDTERWAVASQGHKYILQTMSGDEELYDLAADPGEQDDLASKADDATLAPWRAALSRATGWPAGAGFRLRISRRTRTPFVIRLPAPGDAIVLDPESGKERRANIEWEGIQPDLADDIGLLSRAEDGASFRFEPGPVGTGTLAVLPADASQGLTVRVGEQDFAISAEGGSVRTGDLHIEVLPGGVILPQDSVRERLEAQAQEEADDSALEALRELGYIE